MLGALAGIIGMGTGISIGASSGSVESASSLSLLFCTIFVPLTICGLVIDHSKNKELKSLLQTKRSSLLQIAKKYNAVTDLLKSEYHHKKKELGFFNSSQKESLRNAYEQQYLSNAKAFEQERTLFLDCFEATTPTAKRFKAYWKRFIAIGLLTQVIACGYTVGSMPDITTDVSTNSTVQSTTTREWNADNIPMPHLTDGSRYVSNPDKVVSEHTEQLLNRWLKRMDDSLLIESAMIIVNHVENEDPFRMAQDIFDKYKVGKNDRGLVIVLAYQDHKVRTHTGRALEADLTDIECSRLQQTYAIPSMKAEQPDSGMLYLTEAIYNTLQKKELPRTYAQQLEDESDKLAAIVALYMLLFLGWALLILYLKHKYDGISGRNLLKPNPFAKAAAPVVIIGGGRSHGGFGGGGGFSGGFSGGSSGGGGATSSW